MSVNITFNQFFDVNRFLYEHLCNTNKPSYMSISTSLGISNKVLKSVLLRFSLPVNIKILALRAKEIQLTNDPPPVYTVLSGVIRENKPLNLMFIELIEPLTLYHFDYVYLLRRYSNFNFKIQRFALPQKY